MSLSDRNNRFQSYAKSNVSIQDGNNLIITLYMRLLSPYNWSTSFSSADIQGLAKDVSCYD